jgi:murein DD-endopeptidase MepM/ murein hydrolase activator NlpD
MKRFALLAAIALAGLAATARADNFILLPAGTLGPASAKLPNQAGAVLVPADFTTPPLEPVRLSYPDLQSLWQRAGAAYDIPGEVLAAINKVESNFGRNMGPSSAGAVGWMQFMPATWLEYGIDASGDGVADPWNPVDAVYSAARYLAASGGRANLARAVFAYNHAQWYVDEVLQLARLYSQNGSSSALALDRLQQSLAQAEQAVVRASAAKVAATSSLRALEQRRGTSAATLAAARARVKQLESALLAARSRLTDARDSARVVSFTPAAGTLLGAPAYQNDYVFPVGGGPGLVSVSHFHHDYPAADIAAPSGSPVYALANAVVIAAFPAPSGVCGIGVTLRTADGRRWLYCHLAYLEPSAHVGASLLAGTPVGLVGSTGDASGPHLHLQLVPANAYPQDQPWFERFGGNAFAWQDGGLSSRALVPGVVPQAAPAASSPRLLAAAGSRIFAVVQNGSLGSFGPIVPFIHSS